MLVPKLFRWIFFRKKSVKTTFDALRNPETIYIDTSSHLGETTKTFEGSRRLGDSDINSFAQETDKDHPIILFGNNKSNIDRIHNQLEKVGFQKVFNVGSVEELIKIKEELK